MTSQSEISKRTDELDVVDALESVGIQKEIKESKRGLVMRNKEVIKQRDYARHRLDIGAVSWVRRRRAEGLGSRERDTETAQFVPSQRVTTLLTTTA